MTNKTISLAIFTLCAAIATPSMHASKKEQPSRKLTLDEKLAREFGHNDNQKYHPDAIAVTAAQKARAEAFALQQERSRVGQETKLITFGQKNGQRSKKNK